MTTAANDLAIDLHHVAKVYRGRVHALQGIEMQVRRGEIFGLLGPNGAGKSTLVKIMMTVIRPTSARGTILGSPIGNKGTLARVGYLPENHRFPRYLTGRQTLEFFSALAAVSRPERKRRSAELLEVVGMSAWADKKIGTYSKGMMQRVGLAQAMMNDPDLILLDEPTDGVDPVGRREIRDVLAGLRGQGKTVFINSHLLSELEMVCDRVSILVAGQVATHGTLDELALAKQWYEVELATVNGNPPTAETITAAAASGAPWQPAATPTVGSLISRTPATPVPQPTLRATLPTGKWIEVQGQTVRVGTTDPADVQPVLDALRRAQLVIRRVQMFRPSLEDLFIDAVYARTGGRSAAGATIGAPAPAAAPAAAPPAATRP